MPINRNNLPKSVQKDLQSNLITQNNLDGDIPLNETNINSSQEEHELQLELVKLDVSQRGRGILSIVNTTKNGKRIHLSKTLTNILHLKEDCYIGITSIGIVVSKNEIKNSLHYQLRTMGGKNVIYSSKLVDYVTEKFKLDFKNASCITFKKYEITKINNVEVVVVKIGGEDNEKENQI